MTRRTAPRRRLDREEVYALTGLIALFATTAAWWALAFWPVAAAPAWLERTRYVCFGVGESGLPDAGGWIGLVAGPLGMFAILAVGWRRGMSGLFRHARRSPAVAAVLIGLGTGTVVMVSGAAVLVQQARAGAELAVVAGGIPPATYPRLDRAAPPLVLVAHTGETFDLAALAGRPVLVTFAYAHCATVCPVIVKHTLDAQAALRGTVHDAAAVVVTLDPWRDTPSRLPAMARQWGLPDRDAWILSGAVHDVEAALDAWNIPRSRDLATGEVTHPSLVYVIDRAGRIAYASTGGTDALIALVQRL